jgi:hypothetical protein
MITDPAVLALRRDIYVAMLAKSGVREWESAAANESLWTAAIAAANGILGITDMALPDYIKISAGTPKTIRSSGGDAAITLASLANGNGTSAGGRQSATLDLGANWAQRWRIDIDIEMAATPTAGNAINLFASYSATTGAGKGNTSGSDAAYTGYSSNIDQSTKQLEFLGSHIVTGQATTTVQKSNVGICFPKGRYLNLVVDNRAGSAVHSDDSNCVITLTPLEESIED